MSADTPVNKKKQRLLTLLREMFQLDQPDLDFGLYRIMHAKRGQVEAFLESEFDQLIDQVFAGRGARREEDAKKDYEAVRQQAVEFGSADPDSAPKVQQARARYDAIRLTGGEDAEIYDHLHRFFSRYYDAGDFMSLRRYGKGAAGGAETYAIPYDGSEVVLHWANKDQYYIKTTENFSAFSFDPRQALQKDEKGINRQLFDDAETGAPLKVHFRVVEAAEGAHNNVKAGDKEERYFILDGEAPIAWEGGDLLIRLNYRPDPEKSGQKAKWQEKRNDQTAETVLAALADTTGDHQALAGEYRAVLARDVHKGKDKKQPLLGRYLARYTASNTMDYFIHKDLGGFLRRELDFYLKNEVLKLDDFVGSEDGAVQAGISESQVKAMRTALEKTQAIRLLAQRLIDFLAQLEDFQKKLWLKKKFVVETNYCITLDRIPEKFYPEIVANERQREEWVRLFAIDEIYEDLAMPGYSVPLTVEFLQANPFLLLDTNLFCEAFNQGLLAEVEGLDEQANGFFIHSDNFQALRLIQDKFLEQVDCIYIDPPYNTGEDGFPYKDGYRHSSWASMILHSSKCAKALLNDKGSFISHIDDNELFVFKNILTEVMGYGNFLGAHTWLKRYAPPPDTKDFGYVTEAVLFFRASLNFRRRLLPLTEDQTSRYKNPDNDPRGAWKAADYTCRYTADERPTLYYPITNPYTGEEIWPSRSRVWAFSKNVHDTNVKEKRIWWGKDGANHVPALKNFLSEINQGSIPCTLLHYDQVGHTDEAAKELRSIFPDIKTTPKPTRLAKYIATVAGDKQSLFLDYFVGTGSSIHGLIDLNREDDGQRRYIGMEINSYFDTVLKPRIQRAVYSRKWQDGRPIGREGISHCFKYLRLESYEDCLNNLVLNPTGAAAAAASGDAAFQRDYLLRYMLDVETQGSQSLLNVAEFRDPTAYQLEIKKPGSDERTRRNIDLVETFNWLIGLHVDKLHAGRRYAANFARKPDPLAPDDTHTRLQVETLTPHPNPSPHGGQGLKTWWFRPVEGHVRTVPGDDRHRQSVLVLWRTLTEDPEQDSAVLETFLAQHLPVDPTRKEDKTLYDLIYINGTHNLPNLGRYGEVRLLEEEFHRRMWAGEEI